jgi:hypothetical protein
MSEPLPHYKGSHTLYTDVAAKDDVRIGLGIDYAVHPGNAIGYIVVRFVARHVSEGSPSNLGPFTHFQDRDGGKFVMLGGDSAHQTLFKGRRLNKVLIPAFNPAPCGHQIAKVGDEYNIWQPIAAWIADQIAKEGFTLLMPDLVVYVRAQVAGPEQAPPVLVLEFADLPKPKPSKFSHGFKKSDKDDDDDEDDDDKDDDEEGWVN